MRYFENDFYRRKNGFLFSPDWSKLPCSAESRNKAYKNTRTLRSKNKKGPTFAEPYIVNTFPKIIVKRR